jgi:hypothetical protein
MIWVVDTCIVIINQYRQRKVLRRPVADILIGAFAAGRHGLLTRNAADFRRAFPTLKIIEPPG